MQNHVVSGRNPTEDTTEIFFILHILRPAHVSGRKSRAVAESCHSTDGHNGLRKLCLELIEDRITKILRWLLDANFDDPAHRISLRLSLENQCFHFLGNNGICTAHRIFFDRIRFECLCINRTDLQCVTDNLGGLRKNLPCDHSGNHA